MIRIHRLFLLSMVGALSTATALSQTQTLLTRHIRTAISSGQAKAVGHMPATQTLRLTLTLPLRNEAQLDKLLQDLYNPDSPSYRHFLTVEQFTAQFGPTQDDYDAVVDFANTHGLHISWPPRPTASPWM